LALLFIVSAARSPAQEAAEPEVPEYAPLADPETVEIIEEQGFRILPGDFSERSYADYNRELRIWLKKHLEDPYVATMRERENPWAEEAASFIREALDCYQPPHVVTETNRAAVEAIYERGKKLYLGGNCPERLVHALLLHLQFHLLEHNAADLDSIVEVTRQEDFTFAKHEGSSDILCAVLYNKSRARESESRYHRDDTQASYNYLIGNIEKIAGERKLLAQDDPVSDRIYLRFLLDKLDYSRPYERADLRAEGALDRARQAYVEWGPSAYAREVGKARWHNLCAGGAFPVWKYGEPELVTGHSRDEHDEIAYLAAEKAWEMNPDLPDAPREALRALRGADNATLWTWYERCAKAEIDFPTAPYTLRLRLTDEIDDLLSAIAIASTPRYETEIYQAFYGAMNSTVSMARDRNELFNTPIVRTAILALEKNLADCPERKQERAFRKSLQVRTLWRLGEYGQGREILEQLATEGLTFDRRITDGRLVNEGVDARQVEGETYLFADPRTAELYGSAMEALDRGQFEGAERQLRELKGDFPSDAAPAAREQTRSVHATARLAVQMDEAANWVSIPVEPGLPGWQVRSGNWQGTKNGELLMRGNHEASYVMLRAPMPDAYEMRGAYRFKAGDNCCRHMTCMLGVPTIGTIKDATWRQPVLMAGQVTKGRSHAGFLRNLQTDPRFSESKFIGGRKPMNSIPFVIRVERDVITFRTAGKGNFENVSVAELKRSMDREGHVVFGTQRACMFNTFWVSGLEIRALR